MCCSRSSDKIVSSLSASAIFYRSAVVAAKIFFAQTPVSPSSYRRRQSAEEKKNEKKLTAAEGKQGVVVDGGRCGNRENCWLEREKNKNQRLVLPNFRDGKKLASKELGECRGIVAEREKKSIGNRPNGKKFFFSRLSTFVLTNSRMLRQKKSGAVAMSLRVCVWYVMFGIGSHNLKAAGEFSRATKPQKWPFPLHSLTNI